MIINAVGELFETLENTIRTMTFLQLEMNALADFRGLCSQDATKMFLEIRKAYNFLLTDIHNFLLRSSGFIQEKMKHLEMLLEKFPSLANINTYKIMQKETSEEIWKFVSKDLESNTFFFR